MNFKSKLDFFKQKEIENKKKNIIELEDFDEKELNKPNSNSNIPFKSKIIQNDKPISSAAVMIMQKPQKILKKDLSIESNNLIKIKEQKQERLLMKDRISFFQNSTNTQIRQSEPNHHVNKGDFTQIQKDLEIAFAKGPPNPDKRIKNENNLNENPSNRIGRPRMLIGV